MAFFKCPSCGHTQTVEDKHIGRYASCPKCKTQADVQEDAAPAAPAVLPKTEDPDGPITRRSEGESMGIASLVKNNKSSLKHEWIVIDDPRMCLQFTGIYGVTPAYDRVHSTSHHTEYRYEAKFAAKVGQTPITAYEVRFLTFDIWGKHVRTLSGSFIEDLPSSAAVFQELGWRLFDETEAWEHYASIGYVSRVRTKQGMVLSADSAAILREAQRFSEQFSAADLEPKSPKKE